MLRDPLHGGSSVRQLAAMWRGRRVLVTGADGFVGSDLADILATMGAEVYALVHQSDPHEPIARMPPKFERVLTCDIRDFHSVQQAVARANPALLFHMAAITQVKEGERIPRATFDINVMGTVNLLDAVRTVVHPKESCSVVVASSDKYYGRQTEFPITESALPNPIHPYDASKTACDFAAQSYAAFYNIPLAIARMANIYGPGDMNWDRIIPGTIRAYVEGSAPIVRSDGSPVRDYLYIEDAVRAYLLLADRLDSTADVSGIALNFSGPQPEHSVREIIEKIRYVMDDQEIGQPSLDPEVANTSKTEEQRIVLSDDRARHLIGWMPRINMGMGLVTTVHWVNSFIKARELARKESWHI